MATTTFTQRAFALVARPFYALFYWLVRRIMFYRFCGHMATGMQLVAMGRLFVFRETPTWVLIWAREFGDPGEDELLANHRGIDPERMRCACSAYNQAMMELDLRMRPVLKIMREQVRTQAPHLSEEAVDKLVSGAHTSIPFPLFGEDPIKDVIELAEAGEAMVKVERVQLSPQEALEQGFITDKELLELLKGFKDDSHDAPR